MLKKIQYTDKKQTLCHDSTVQIKKLVKQNILLTKHLN